MSDVRFDALSVMIVDDNPQMRALLSALLRAIGILRIREVRDGALALQEMRSAPADIIITDYAMEPMNGIEFTRMARTASDNANPMAAIIMLTGHAERARVEEARDAGVTEFLAKPVTAKSLFDKLASVIDNPRMFIRTRAYVGPDRRRRRSSEYQGPFRRAGDVRQDSINIE